MSQIPHQDRVDVHDDVSVTFWREKYGVTTEQLEEAVKAVGDRPDDVVEHLLNQGSSGGAS